MDGDSCYISDALKHQATDHANGEPPCAIVYAQPELRQNHHAEEDGEEEIAAVTGPIKKVRLCQTTCLEAAVLCGNRDIAASVWIDSHR